MRVVVVATRELEGLQQTLKGIWLAVEVGWRISSCMQRG